MTFFDDGTPADYGLKLAYIDGGLYGLTYTGFWGCKAWCYAAIGPEAAVFCQPFRQENGAVGTSITNIWSPEFYRAVLALPPISRQGQSQPERALYEHYYDDPPFGISRVTLAHPGIQGDTIKWAPVKASFADLVGWPKPDFLNLSWGHDAAARCEAHNKARAGNDDRR